MKGIIMAPSIKKFLKLEEELEELKILIGIKNGEIEAHKEAILSHYGEGEHLCGENLITISKEKQTSRISPAWKVIAETFRDEIKNRIRTKIKTVSKHTGEITQLAIIKMLKGIYNNTTKQFIEIKKNNTRGGIETKVLVLKINGEKR